MKIGFSYFAGCGLLVLATTSWGADKPQMKDTREKASYGVGVYFGNQIKRSNMELDLDLVNAGIKDVLAGHELNLTDQQSQDAIKAYQQEMQAKSAEKNKIIAEKNKKDGEAFLAENKKKPGVKTHMVTLPDGTTAEMQYKVLAEGSGAMPKSNDTV